VLAATGDEKQARLEQRRMALELLRRGENPTAALE
jgi:hypothetical protein